MTPRPATALPQCAEDLLTELGNEELFRRILAVGYMSTRRLRKTARKIRRGLQTKHHQRSCSQIQHFFFKVDGSQARCSLNREDTQHNKMLKAEKKEEPEGKTPTGSRAVSPEEQATPQPSHLQGVKRNSNKTKFSVLSGPPNIPKVNRPKS